MTENLKKRTVLEDHPAKVKTTKQIYDHPCGLKKGYHLVQVNHNTWIEVRNGLSDKKAVKKFVEKLNARDREFYSNMQIKSAQHLET